MNNYNIVTLGPSGAGKTVFLASLFKQLSIQGEHGFFLQVEDANKRNILNNIYTEIITGDKWPKGTKGEITDWVFTCCVKTPSSSIYPVCQFTYIDYAGGRLTDTAEEDDDDFESKVCDADAVLAILDGQKVLAFMQDKEITNRDVRIWVYQHLPNLMQLINKCGPIPIHFIISKWDLIDKKYELLEVRNRLLEAIFEFRNVVHNINQANCPVRLIPVSSVGMKFATPQPDGSMKKNFCELRPFQVEAPLAYVLTDGLERQINRLQKTGLDKFSEQLFHFFSNNIIAPSTDLIKQNLPEKYNLENHVLQRLVDLTERSVQKVEKWQNLKAESLKKVKDEKTALSHSINSFRYIQTKLINDFPASDLKGVGI
ncbi:hypothetical protein F7734_17745 [Scytonema sp. UIC 10036]|uniref:hypothetical protein n=1 Tax=Scytonema sp. UIC 10036 TaxID=2304196 RepID=UPI0012DA0DCF|nr:hypothetical protein [Scytonema sp. UIC 10036]MUG94131.1 hypothetical protein [Scytonema sp. UIC 10036]